MRSTAIWIGGAVPLVLALAFSGCGGSSGSGAATGGSSAAGSSSAASSSAAHGSNTSPHSAHAAHSSDDTVATVNGTPITKAAFAHWLAVTAALSGKSSHGKGSSNEVVKTQALGFLISTQWLLAEAAARGVNVSEADIRKRLDEVQGKQFKQPGELQRYLAHAHETQADLLLRVKLELLEQAISKQATAAKHTTAEKQAALSSLQKEFQKKWKAKTSCSTGYVVEDCREF